MRFLRRKKEKKGSILVLAMLDIISNAMAGIAVLFFIHVALQLQEPPPIPVRGRLVFEIEFTSEIVGSIPPSIFIRYRDETNKSLNYRLFDEEIDKRKLKFKFTEESVAQIQLDRLIFQDIDNPNKWYIHLMDPFKGYYSVGTVYRDHQLFTERQVLHQLKMRSYFELAKGSHEYKSRTIKHALNSPTSFHELEVYVDDFDTVP